MARFSWILCTLLLLPDALWACPFCSEERGPTLVGDFAQANMVLFGTFANAQLKGDDSTTEFHIEKVLKPHEIVKGKEKITLSRYINQPKSKFLLFCDVYKDTIDPYRGVEVQAKSDMVKYLVGAMEVKEKSPGERLRYCFDFLNNSEYEVAIDAYREFAKADYQDYKDMAKKLDPNVLTGWLKDPKTPAFRFGLYASLLGHCGKEEHAKMLRGMLEDTEKRKGSGIDGLFAGYLMIDPKEAWTYLASLLKDGKQDFSMRYSCLRTLRFLWDQRPDLVPQKDLVTGLAAVLEHADMSDFAVEDLRKYKRWEMTDAVLSLAGRKTHDIPVIKRSLLRFALQSPEKKAQEYVQTLRKIDIEMVKDAEELLKLELGPAGAK